MERMKTVVTILIVIGLGLLAVGEPRNAADPVVPLEQSESLYVLLLAVGVPVELVVVKNAGHGFRPTGGEIEPRSPR